VVIGPNLLAQPSCPAAALGYAYQKTITLNHNKVSGGSDLTNFPVLINILGSQELKTTINGGHVQNASGYDIIFTDASYNKLDHQIESYDAVNGNLVAWVRIPVLSASVNTPILLLYGNPQISLDPSVKTVWKSSYQGVWHMGDNPGGAVPQLKDAAQSNDGTSNGAMVPGDLVPGNIGNAIHFDGTDDYFDVGTGISPGRTFTEECWIQLGSQSDGSYHGFLGFDSGENYNRAPSMWIVYQNRIHAGFGDNTTWCLWQTPGSVLNIDGITWNHVVTTFDGTDYKLYINGAIVFDDPEWAGRIPCNTPLRNIGRVDNYFTGNLDEVRVLSEALSSGWITTEYNNQKSPPTFYSVGVESPCSVFTFSGLCSGSPIIYSVPNTTGHSYSWTVAGGNPSSTIGNSITVTWNASGPYSIQLAESDGSCNGLSIPYTIVVRANPVITTQPLAPAAVCESSGIQSDLSVAGEPGFRMEQCGQRRSLLRCNDKFIYTNQPYTDDEWISIPCYSYGRMRGTINK
jgi:hypothetical protein